ncbi:DNA recombination protein RmuC [Aeromonas sp. 74A]
MDARRSPTAYERWYNADDELEKAVALKEHVASVRNHIRELGRKDYQQLPGVRTLDYVLMFVAVEPAFLTAMEADPSLVRYGLDNNILLVSPTNLMVALRTIENLWRYERQNQNARQIAERPVASTKSCGCLSRRCSRWAAATRRRRATTRQWDGWSTAAGNGLRRSKRFRELGVEVTKKPARAAGGAGTGA